MFNKLVLIALAAIFAVQLQSAVGLPFSKPTCSKLVDNFVKTHGQHATFSNKSDAFIFFLHVPRTAGKTYASCFLKPALPPTQRCAPSYDFLRLNVSQESCRYVVSHDDYSLTSQLPEQNTLVVTQLRDPVSRVLSAYEFGIEVAARKVRQAEEKFQESARNTSFVNTLNVWPWSHVVPWFRWNMRENLAHLDEIADTKGTTRPRLWTEHFDKSRNRTYYWSKRLNQSVWTLPKANLTLDPYANELVIPLHQWLDTDNARELIHDGATLQILGITNYSYWEGAKELRDCYFDDPASRRKLIDVAKDRLRHMHHVGLTEELDSSVASLAAGLGYDLAGPSYKSVRREQFSYDAPDFDVYQTVEYNSTREVPGGVMTQLTVLEARKLLLEMRKEMDTINGKLRKLEPDLKELVDKEAKWLEEQDKLDQERLWVVAKLLALKDGVAERAGKLNTWLKALTNWPPAAHATEVDESAEDTASVDTISDDEEKQGGPMDDHDDGLQDFYNDENGEEELPVYADDIESPWAAEIVRLDAQVYSMQQRRDGLLRDIDALIAIPEVRGPEVPEGRGKLLGEDAEFVDNNTSLGAAYRRCSNQSRKRSTDKRKNAFKELVTPWHETFAFSSTARKFIDDETLERIRELNPGDVEIWEFGKQLLQEALEEQKAAGTLQEVPPVEEKKAKRKTKSTADGTSVEAEPAEEPIASANENDHDEL